jgi:uncharacterized protein Smg (DUF494 family)
MEILVFLLAEMRGDKSLTEIDLKPLSQRGFSETEISTAFSWLFDKIALNGGPDDNPLVFAEPVTRFANLDPRRDLATDSSVRVYHDVERAVIGAEAQGYLLQVHQLGLLSDSDVEFIIDRIMMAGVPSVSLDDVKDLVATTAFDFEDSFRTHSRLMLNASDRIQ